MNPYHIRIDVLQEPDIFKLKEVVNIALANAKFDVTSVNFLDQDDNGYTAIISFDISRNARGERINKT